MSQMKIKLTVLQNDKKPHVKINTEQGYATVNIILNGHTLGYFGLQLCK